MVADGIQVGSLQFSPMFSKAVLTFAAFWGPLRSLQNFFQSEWRLPTLRSSSPPQLPTGHLPALHEPTRGRIHAPRGSKGRPQSARAHKAMLKLLELWLVGRSLSWRRAYLAASELQRRRLAPLNRSRRKFERTLGIVVRSRAQSD